MGMFKAGAAVGASMCALAIVAGHGHLGAGFARLGRDAQATVEFVAPAANKAFGSAGSAMRSSGFAAKQALESTAAAAASMAQGATQAAAQAAAHGGASARALGARHQQSTLRSEIYGAHADQISPSAAQLSDYAGRVTRQGLPVGADTAREAVLEATAENLLRDNAGLRALALPDAQHAAFPGSPQAAARASAIHAFARAFARGLDKYSSPQQAALWSLPGPGPGSLASAPHIDNPINAALASAIEAAHGIKARLSSAAPAPCPSWALDPTPALDRKELSAQALELGGQARLFAASRAGVQPAEISAIAGKLSARRAALSTQDPSAPAPGEPSAAL